jgi:hypothetical protein
VVGGIEVFDDLSAHSAGVRPTKINEFNGPSANARINAKETWP